MAESSVSTKEVPSGGGWWSSWLAAAREKSVTALTATQRDLGEFVSILHQDTSAVVGSAASTIRGMLATEQGKDHTEIAQDSTPGTTPPSSREALASGPYDRSQTQMQALRSNPQTYCSIPEGKSGDFLQWCSNFDLAQHQEEISLLLVEAGEIRQLHSQLVPSSVSYEAFWHHYFYRVHVMQVEESRRAEIMARVSSEDQLIDWEEEEEPRDSCCEPVRTEDSSQKAMSDSSESFVCVSEEDPVAFNQQELVEKRPSPDAENSDSDWEKWSD